MRPLLGVRSFDGDVPDALTSIGTVFCSFLEQDSGCWSHGVVAHDGRWFVKHAVEADAVAERLPGSTRIMAPEEWRRGGCIDERTTVFNLARLGLDLLNDRPPAACRETAARATEPDPEARYQDVRSFIADWRRAAVFGAGP